MAGYTEDIGTEKNTENRWIKLDPGVYVLRILPPASSYFDPDADPLDYFYYEKKVIWNFPLSTGSKNIVVDKNHIVQRALRAYQLTLGDWEAQKIAMRAQGHDKLWPKTRGCFNVITGEKKDKPYWIDLPKTAVKELLDFIKADPSIIDLEKGRFVRLTIKGSGRTDKSYSIEISKKVVPITLGFDHSLLDDIKNVVAPDEISVADIQEPLIKKWAIKLLKEEKELADLDAGVPTPPKASKGPAKTSKPAANDTFDDDDGFGGAPEVADDFGMEEFEKAAGADDSEDDDDISSFRQQIDDDFDD